MNRVYDYFKARREISDEMYDFRPGDTFVFIVESTLDQPEEILAELISESNEKFPVSYIIKSSLAEKKIPGWVKDFLGKAQDLSLHNIRRSYKIEYKHKVTGEFYTYTQIFSSKQEARRYTEIRLGAPRNIDFDRYIWHDEE
jgi:hypothetical protein